MADRLIEAARAAQQHAHCPYSNYRVGAALETTEGKVFVGSNVENASFGLTICAERNALFGALARGATRFRRIAIACDSSADCVPCGACRQVLLEHAPDLVIIIASKKGGPEALALKDLLPRPFLNF